MEGPPSPDPSPARGEGSTATALRPPVGENAFPLSRLRERGLGGEGPRETLLFALLLVLHLVPIWAFAYFPSQDGPAHLNNANILREYFGSYSPLFREYFSLNRSPEPNWFGHLILAGLMSLAPPLLAEKLLLSAYILLLPLSVRYAARGVRADAGFLAVLAFPFLYSYPLHMGFYYFCFSLAVFFFTIGYWLRHRERFGLRQTVILTGLWLLLYFTHIVSLVTAWIVIGLLALWLTGLDLLAHARWREREISLPGRALGLRLLIPLFTCLPTFVFMLGFLAEKGVGRFELPDLTERLRGLWRLESLASFVPAELWLSRGVVLLFLAVTLGLLVARVRRPEPSRWDGLLLVVLALVATYALAPHAMASGAYIPQRLILYPFLVLILWFAAQRWSRGSRWGVQLAAGAVALAMLGVHSVTYARANHYLREYTAAAERVAPNTTLLALSFSHWGGGLDERLGGSRIGAFLHASGYIGAERRVVALHNYQANQVHFPVRFRSELNPFLHISSRGAASIESIPPAVEFLTYPERTGGRVDYVLLWGLQDGLAEHEDVRSIFAQLEAGYELIHTSPGGLAQLYRSRGS